MKKIFFLAFLFVIFSINVFAVECGVNPTYLCDISSSVTFGGQNYNLSAGTPNVGTNGIIVADVNNSIIDCNNSVLIGENNLNTETGTNMFFVLFSNNLTFRDCNFQNVRSGIVIDNESTDIKIYNTEGNNVGVDVISSYARGTYIDNINSDGNLFLIHDSFFTDVYLTDNPSNSAYSGHLYIGAPEFNEIGFNVSGKYSFFNRFIIYAEDFNISDILFYSSGNITGIGTDNYFYLNALDSLYDNTIYPANSINYCVNDNGNNLDYYYGNSDSLGTCENATTQNFTDFVEDFHNITFAGNVAVMIVDDICGSSQGFNGIDKGNMSIFTNVSFCKENNVNSPVSGIESYLEMSISAYSGIQNDSSIRINFSKDFGFPSSFSALTFDCMVGIGNGNLSIDLIYSNGDKEKYSFNSTNCGVYDFNTVSITSLSETQRLSNIIFYYNNPSTAHTFTIDNLRISDISNLNVSDEILINNNSLPNFNVSFKKSEICINDTNQLELNLNVSDSENDIIYYATKFLTERDISKTVSYNKDVCIAEIFFGFGCNNGILPDLSFMDRVFYKNENTCVINSNISYSQDSFNLVQYELRKNTFLGINDIFEYGLLLSETCSKSDKTFYYDVGQNLQNIYYLTELYSFGCDINQVGCFADEREESFNITFYDSQLLEVAKIKFSTNSTIINTYYYNYSSNAFIQIMNATWITPLIFSMTTFLNGTNSALTVSNVTGGTKQFENILSEFPVRYIAISIDGITSIWQRKFTYSGVSTNLNWTTIKPINITVSDIGYIRYTLYVSDSAHIQSNDYISKTITGSIKNNELCIFSNIEYGDADNLRPNTGITAIDDLIYGLRQFYILFIQLGILSAVLLAFKAGIIYFIYREWHDLTQAQQPQEHIFRIIFIKTFFIVTILFFMLLIEKVWIIVFSGFALIYAGHEVLNIYGTKGTDENKQILFVTAMFNILLYIWFGLLQFASNISFGIPSFPTLTVANFNPIEIVSYLVSVLGWFISLVFFTIPDIPEVINFIFILLRIIGVISLALVVKNSVLPTVKG